MILTDVFKDVRKPKPFPYKKEVKCANPDLIIGLELETEQCQYVGVSVSIEAIERCGYCLTSDGSLRGSAYEFISKPIASKHALASLDDFFNLTKFTEVNYTDRCSTHVHVNCTDLTLEQITNVALIYQVVEDILFEFVGHNRESNLYCIPWNQCRDHYHLVSNFLASPGLTLKSWNKYTALNLLPLMRYGTVEFRQMHGTSDMEKLSIWINIIGSLFNYATKVELNDLTTMIKELNTTSHYENFFNSVIGGYLPYTDNYRMKLEDGVILAKFGLTHSYKVPKVVRATPGNTIITDDLVGNERPGGGLFVGIETLNRNTWNIRDAEERTTVPLIDPMFRNPVPPLPNRVITNPIQLNRTRNLDEHRLVVALANLRRNETEERSI